MTMLKEEIEMSSTGGTRVMVVDDHPIVRKGLQDLLQDSGGFEVVRLVSNGEEAVNAAQETQPDVIVMDVMMPGKDGVEACRDILDLLPDAKVLMYTASTDEDAVVEAITAGAAGFVQKYADSDEVVKAIREVAAGRLLIPDDAVRRVFTSIRRGTVQSPSTEVLTPRERDILSLFARGMSYAQIAEARSVSMVTARNAIYRVQDKLGVNSKQEIVVWAVRNGLLDEDEDGRD